MKSIEQWIAEELGVRASQVQAAIELLDGGSAYLYTPMALRGPPLAC